MRRTTITVALVSLALGAFSAPALATAPGDRCDGVQSKRSQFFSVTAKTDRSHSQLRLIARLSNSGWTKQVIDPRVRLIVRWKLRDGLRIIDSGRLVSVLSPSNTLDRVDQWVDDVKRERQGLRLDATIQYKVFFNLPGVPSQEKPWLIGIVHRVEVLSPKLKELRPVRLVCPKVPVRGTGA